MPQRAILEEIFLLSAKLLTGNSINERWERLTLAEIEGWIGKSAENAFLILKRKPFLRN